MQGKEENVNKGHKNFCSKYLIEYFIYHKLSNAFARKNQKIKNMNVLGIFIVRKVTQKYFV
jgi:hypothetical protein